LIVPVSHIQDHISHWPFLPQISYPPYHGLGRHSRANVRPQTDRKAIEGHAPYELCQHGDFQFKETGEGESGGGDSGEDTIKRNYFSSFLGFGFVFTGDHAAGRRMEGRGAIIVVAPRRRGW